MITGVLKNKIDALWETFEIFKELRELEAEIQKGLEELEGMV